MCAIDQTPLDKIPFVKESSVASVKPPIRAGQTLSKKPCGDTLYNRSFFLTFGGLMLTLPVWIWVAQGRQSGSWPVFAWILFFCMPIVGACFLLFGIIASDQKIDSSIYIVPTRNGLIMAILALPLYCILKTIRRKRPLHK